MKSEVSTYGEDFNLGSYEHSGLTYKDPKVVLLNSVDIGVGEIAARTCYDSFESSDNDDIVNFGNSVKNDCLNEDIIQKAKSIDRSKLLHDLSWTYFHHSILEHMSYTFYIEDIGRGVLQEHARHRIQSLSVRSTRYTMQPLLNAFVASLFFTDRKGKESKEVFLELSKKLDIFIIKDEKYIDLSLNTIFEKLIFQMSMLENSYLELMLSKDARDNIAKMTPEDVKSYKKVFKVLNESKKKRNVGDSFKHLVDDNWKVSLVCTFNLRSLKNYLNLRNNGAAYFQIKKLAEKMEEQLPENVLKLIIKKYKDG